jgi:hypothetical protein
MVTLHFYYGWLDGARKILIPRYVKILCSLLEGYIKIIPKFKGDNDVIDNKILLSFNILLTTLA